MAELTTGSEVADKVRHALLSRSRSVLYSHIIEETGLSQQFLTSLSLARNKEYDIVRLEKLYKYLTGRSIAECFQKN